MHPLDQRRLGGRHEDGPDPALAGQADHRQYSLEVAQAPVERQLAEEQHARDVGPDLLRGEQDPDGDLSKVAPWSCAGQTGTPRRDRAGVAERTARRRLQEPDFRQRLHEARTQMVERAVAVLADASAQAALTLRDLLHSRNDLVRISAARAILELGPKLRESTELAERVAALEGRP